MMYDEKKRRAGKSTERGDAMKGTKSTKTRVYVGKHARVATRDEEPGGERQEGTARRLIACLCALMLVAALIPATALTQAFAEDQDGDVRISTTDAYDTATAEGAQITLSPALVHRGPINLSELFVAQVYRAGEEEGEGSWSNLTADDGTFTFEFGEDVVAEDDEDLIVFEKDKDGIWWLKLTGKPTASYADAGLSISVRWSGASDGAYSNVSNLEYDANGEEVGGGFVVASGDFSDEDLKTYTVISYGEPVTVTLGGGDEGSDSAKLSEEGNTPVPVVMDFDMVTPIESPTYTVMYEVPSSDETDFSDVLEIVGDGADDTVKVKEGMYATTEVEGGFFVTATYTFTEDFENDVAYVDELDNTAPIGIELISGLNKDSIALGTDEETGIDALNEDTDYVAKDPVKDPETLDTWYVRADTEFIVPVTITDSLLYSQITGVSLMIGEESEPTEIAFDANGPDDDEALLEDAFSDTHA
ncbi:MAG: hypothetical protein LBJ48_01715, partial [Coriobacteriales bacterium]|nr:hypothetical protein [Coriobacteriales bacterium]